MLSILLYMYNTYSRCMLPHCNSLGFMMSFLCRRNNGVVNMLYHGVRCSQCGLRFTSANLDKYSIHLDWHFRQNRKGKDDLTLSRFRAWYFSLPVSSKILWKAIVNIVR